MIYTFVFIADHGHSWPEKMFTSCPLNGLLIFHRQGIGHISCYKLVANMTPHCLIVCIAWSVHVILRTGS